jgi:hypothetical protein
VEKSNGWYVFILFTLLVRHCHPPWGEDPILVAELAR